MKYYAVTDDPRELYHYGVKGMKWGQHIFGPEPGLKKSDAYRKAQQKLKSLSTKAASAGKSVSNTVKKSAAQASYRRREAQQNRFNKAVAKSEAKNAKLDAKINRYFENKTIKDAKRQAAINATKQSITNTAAQASYKYREAKQNRLNKAVAKSEAKIAKMDAKIDRYFENKPIKDAKRQLAISTAKHNIANAYKAVGNTSAQISYNVKRKQQEHFNKAVAKSEAKNAKLDAKINRYFENKPIKDAKRQLAISTAKQNMKNVFRALGSAGVSTGNAVKNTAAQVSYNVRRKQQEQYNKAVEKANTRNRLSEAMRSYDQDNKLYKQAERERKIENLQEKQANIMADNDLKTLKKAVKVEKHMPDYYQQARIGTLPYGKLSDEQVERLQNRLALEWNTRRLGGTEKPTWREQKKMARREGYLQGITKGTSAAMEEVARAGVQYGIKNLANRKKVDAASKYKAEREKQANRIKNKKTHKEMREDFKQDVYEQQAKEGTAMFTKGAAKRLREAEASKRFRQNMIDDANAERKFRLEEKQNAARDERKFLMDERHSAIRNERQNRENEERDERKFLMDERHNAIRNERQQRENEERDERKFLMDERHNAARTARQNRENEEREDRALERAGKLAYEYGTLLSPSGKNNNQQKQKGKQFTNDDVTQLKEWYEKKHIQGKTNQDIEAERKAHNLEVAQKRQQTMIANKAKKAQEEVEKARAENAARVEEEMYNAKIAADKREAARRKKEEDDLWKERANRIEERQKQELSVRSEGHARELAKMLEKDLKAQAKKEKKRLEEEEMRRAAQAIKEMAKVQERVNRYDPVYVLPPETYKYFKPKKKKIT